MSLKYRFTRKHNLFQSITLKMMPVFLSILFFANCSGRQVKEDARFSYKNVYKDRYEKDGQGGIIPLTLEKGEAYSGSITPDGKYLFFTSNRWDNYDIFFRPLDDVRIIPVVSSATNQKEPAISPNGKYLVYIDDELDPDGDLIYEKIDIDDLTEQFEKGEDPNQKGFLAKKENLTNDEEKRVRSRESNPVWSPDGEKIAFSSDMTSIKGNPFGPGIGAVQNIWIMDPDSKDSATKLTEKGGVMPSFSPDGGQIVFIAYRNRYSRGNIYIIDIQSGKEKQLTSGRDMYLNPSFSPEGKSIIATRISKDTNEDGYIDRKDNGQIVELSLNDLWFADSKKFFSAGTVQGDETEDAGVTENNYYSIIELTLENENIFDTKISGFIGGSIVFAQGVGENINVTMIPRFGIIPKKSTIEKQYDFSKVYLNQYKKENKESLESEDKIEEVEANNADKAARKYLLALQKVEDIFSEDPLFSLYGPKKDIDAYTFLLKENMYPSRQQEILSKIEKQINGDASQYNLYRLLLLYASKNEEGKVLLQSPLKKYIQPNYSITQLVQSGKKTIIQNNTPDEATLVQHFIQENNIIIQKQEKSSIKKETVLVKNLNEENVQKWTLFKNQKKITGRNIYYYFKEKSGDELYSSGDSMTSVKEYRSILDDFPVYFRKYNVIKKIGQSGDSIEIPNIYLHVLYPEKHHLNKKNEGSVESAQSYSNQEKSEIRVLIYEIFRKNLEESRSGINDSILKKFNKETYPEIHYTSSIATSEFYLNEGDHLRAEKELQKVAEIIPEDTIWKYKYHYTMGGIEETRKNLSAAFNHYNSAVKLYQNGYNDKNFIPLIKKFLSYYEAKGEAYKKRSKYKKAWKYYRFLGNIYLQLGAKKILPDLVEKKAMESFIDINSMTLRSIGSKNDEIIDDVTEYYEKNIDFARRYLLNFFIFARAHLNTQTGIFLHSKYEKDKLREKEKEIVFKRFKTAETDFQWSFFADQFFAESYILLGWMYQYIDEKREIIVDKKNNKKDKDKFADLYKKYFPSYLFEENIRLYQKSISYFANKTNPGILASFYLNIGNNYFLLNNYYKAREYYSKLEKVDNYQFESPKQKANFFFHTGKTYYFTSDYEKSIQFLEKAYKMYQSIAPLNLSDKKNLKNNLDKRIIIMKYLAISSELSGDNNAAIKWYNKIIKQQNFCGVWEDRSIYSLEKARLYKDMDNYSMALGELENARKALDSEKEIIAPEYPIRIKWFGFYQPWTWLVSKVYTFDYDFVYVGDNHLAFNIPTVNRRQLYHSMKADILFKKGLYGVAVQDLNELIKYAEKDDSAHGKETLSSAYMRIGEAYFKVNSLKKSEEFYEEALDIAKDNNFFSTQRKARKNLLTLYAYSIENSDKSTEDKLKEIETYIEETRKFIREYIKAKIEVAEEAQKEKNSELELTEKEKEAIAAATSKEIYQIILYQAVFETFKGNLQTSLIKKGTEQNKDYNSFVQSKSQFYSNYSNALHIFSGKYNDNEYLKSPVQIWDKKRNRKTVMISKMNTSIIYDHLDLTEKSNQNNQEIFDEADEFQTFYPLTITSYNLYLNSENTKDGMKYLTNAYEILVQNENLIEYNPGLFKKVYTSLSGELFSSGQYAKAIEIQNQSRHILSGIIIKPTLTSVELSNKKFQSFLETENYLKGQKVTLNEYIERKRLLREDSTEMEKDLVSLENERRENLSSLRNDPDTSLFYDTFYSNMVRESSIYQRLGNYLYIFSDSDYMYFILRKSGSFEAKQITIKELSKINWKQKEPTNSEEKKETVLEGEKKKTDLFRIWYLSNRPEVVFIDENLLGRNLVPYSSSSRYITAQEAFLFVNRNSLSANNWIQIKSQSGIMGFFGGSSNYNLPIEMRIVENEQKIKENKVWAEVVDYELQLDKSIMPVDRNDLSIAQFLSMDHEVKTGIISYNELRSLNQYDRLIYSSAVNLTLGASGFNEVYHFYKKREDAKTNVERIFTGNKIPANQYLWTGNGNIQKFNQLIKDYSSVNSNKNKDYTKINNYKRDYYNAFDKEFKYYYELSKKYQNERSNKLAFDSIHRSSNIQKNWANLKSTRELHGKSSYYSIFLELFYIANKIEEKNSFYNVRMNSLKDQKEKKNNFIKIDLAYQLLYTPQTVSMQNITSLSEKYGFSQTDFRFLMEYYILGRLKKGYVSISQEDSLFRFLLKQSAITRNTDNPIQMKDLTAELMKTTDSPYRWKEAFIASGFFENARLDKTEKVNEYDINQRNELYRYLLKMKSGLSLSYQISDPYVNFIRNPDGEKLAQIDSLNIAELEKQYAYFSYYISINNQNAMLQSLDNMMSLLEQYENSKIDSFTLNALVTKDLLNILMKNDYLRKDRDVIYGKIASIGNKNLDKTIPNFQQQIFYTYLTYFDDRKDNIDSIPEVIRKNNIRNISSVNQSIVNNYYYQSMIDYPETVDKVSYMQIDIYNNDGVIKDRLKYLQSFSQKQSKYLPTNHWQNNINFTYYFNKKQYSNALKHYYYYDTGKKINNFEKYKYPVNGLIKTYAGEYYQWEMTDKIEINKISNEPASIEKLRNSLASENKILTYLPQKEFLIGELELDKELTKYTMRLEKKEEANDTVTEELSQLGDLISTKQYIWKTDSNQQNPGYSILRIHLGQIINEKSFQKKDHEVLIGLVQNESSINNVDIVFWNKTAERNAIINIANPELGSDKSFIFMYNVENKNVFYHFLNLYIEDLKGSNDTLEAFNKSRERITELYPSPEDHNSIIMVHN